MPLYLAESTIQPVRTHGPKLHGCVRVRSAETASRSRAYTQIRIAERPDISPPSLDLAVSRDGQHRSRARGRLIATRLCIMLVTMRHVPSMLGVVVLFGIIYFLTRATLSTPQLALGIGIAILVYAGTMVWHIRNILR